MVTELLALVGTELAWNLVVWLPTLIFSLFFIRLFLGIKLRELIAEIEEHQTASVGAVFFWSALGFSMLVGRAVGDPQTVQASWTDTVFWLLVGIVIAVLFFLIGVAIVIGPLARRKSQSLVSYLRRELRTEHNLSLSLVLGAIFIVPVVVAYHMTI